MSTTLISNHSLLQYYIYTNGSVTDTKIIENNILRDLNVANVFTKVDNIIIKQSNRYCYYIVNDEHQQIILGVHPKLVPILLDTNTILKANTLIEKDRDIINLLFKIQQFIIVRHEYNRYIGLADRFIIFYNIYYGENKLTTYNVERVIDMTTLVFDDFNTFVEIKEQFFNDKEYEWIQFMSLVTICNKILKSDLDMQKAVDKVEDSKDNKAVDINNMKIATTIKTIKPKKEEEYIVKINMDTMIKSKKYLNKNSYNKKERDMLTLYIDTFIDKNNLKEFNKLWSKRVDIQTRKNNARLVVMFLFNDVLFWSNNDIYKYTSSELFKKYNLERMLIQVFDGGIGNAITSIYPRMQIFLFKSLQLFTWYYIRSKNGVERVKETIDWIIQSEDLDISTPEKIVAIDWFDVLYKYDLQAILIGSMYKKDIKLFLKEIFNIKFN